MLIMVEMIKEVDQQSLLTFETENYTIYSSLAAQTYGVCNCMGLIKFQEELYKMTL